MKSLVDNSQILKEKLWDDYDLLASKGLAKN